jgi:hypothetical protein
MDGQTDKAATICSPFGEHKNGEMLIISTQKPDKGVSRSTISPWIKTVKVNAGLGEQYGPPSTRSASTSKAKSCGVDLNTNIKTASWTNAKTFETLYDKNITPSKTVQEAVMSNVSYNLTDIWSDIRN